jgi:hypothetical protein
VRFPALESVLVLSALGGAFAAPPAARPSTASPADPARQVIVDALASGGDAAGQARKLVELAWPSGKRDEVVSARARLELIRFGDHSMEALRAALNSVKPAYTEEVMATILQAQKEARVEFSQAHLPAVIDALWVGNHGAKLLAIQALHSDHTAMAVAPLIDSAIADPTLVQPVVEVLGDLRYPQARFYLETVMMQGPPELRPLAASSLASIGGLALGPLKTALKSGDRNVRLLAVRTLLPAATEYDLGAIYEYIDKHGDDDPQLTEALKVSATSIEKAIAARDASKAADSPKDF